jgi:hypothetical protein
MASFCHYSNVMNLGFSDDDFFNSSAPVDWGPICVCDLISWPVTQVKETISNTLNTWSLSVVAKDVTKQ